VFHGERESAISEEVMIPNLLEGIGQVSRMLLTAFSDYRVTTEDQAAETMTAHRRRRAVLEGLEEGEKR
jgi:hypothetical protein